MLSRRPRGERYSVSETLYTRVAVTFGDVHLEPGDPIPDGALTDIERGQWWRIGRADHARPMRYGIDDVAPPSVDDLTEDELDALTPPQAPLEPAPKSKRARR